MGANGTYYGAPAIYNYYDPNTGDLISSLQFTIPGQGYTLLTGTLVTDVFYIYYNCNDTTGALVALAIFGDSPNAYTIISSDNYWNFNGSGTASFGITLGSMQNPANPSLGIGFPGYGTASPGWPITTLQFNVAAPAPAPQQVTIHLLGSGATR